RGAEDGRAHDRERLGVDARGHVGVEDEAVPRYESGRDPADAGLQVLYDCSYVPRRHHLFSLLQLLDPEAALGGPGATAHLLSAFNAPPLKTFVELAEHPPEPMARGDVARADLDRALDDHFGLGERDLLDPSTFLQDVRDPVEIVRSVLERLLGHPRPDDRAFLEEQAVAGVRHHALVQLLDLAELRLVDFDGSHGRGPHRRARYISSQLVGAGSLSRSLSAPSDSAGEPPAASVDSRLSRVVNRPACTFGQASLRSRR